MPLRKGVRVRIRGTTIEGTLDHLSHVRGVRTRMGPPRSEREQWPLVDARDTETRERVGRVYARADELEVVDG